MRHDFLLLLEPYMWILYSVHVTISLILAVVLSFLVHKRYLVDSESIHAQDKKRLQEISHKSVLFQLLFSVSLHKNNRITSVLFIFLFIVAMPLIGYLFAIWITLYLRYVSYEKKVSNTNILNLDEFGISFLKVERIFGEGSMSELMHNDYAPKAKKLKALSSLASSLSPVNLRIIRTTLSSTDDEIRMYGYATINKAEKALNIKINHYLGIYNSEKDVSEEQRADAAKELANLYWDMIYTELSHESLKDGFLNEVKKYIKVAKFYYRSRLDALHNELYTLAIKQDIEENKRINGAKDKREEYDKQSKIIRDKLLNYTSTVTKLYLLLGKVYMNEKKYDLASTEFIVAQELYEGEASFILPYLAEIQYNMGNYSVVHSIISKSKDLGLNATLFPIVEQWKSA